MIAMQPTAGAGVQRYVRLAEERPVREEANWPVWEVSYVPTLGGFEIASGGIVDRQRLSVLVIERLRAKSRGGLLVRLAERGAQNRYERIDVASIGRVVWERWPSQQQLFG
jgi:hypothetical protein